MVFVLHELQLVQVLAAQVLPVLGEALQPELEPEPELELGLELELELEPEPELELGLELELERAPDLKICCTININ